MAEPRTELLVEIVGEAMRRPPAERGAYVRSACPDPESQREALSLLAALERAGPFLDRPTVPPGAADFAVVKERPGTMVGRYKLLEQIGEGGFGVVFSAEQLEPVRRTVALKIIKLGMDTAAVVARFEAERQTLALMDHPCIAKVLDGGATETGRPYFVMELVRGEPITRYCDLHRLSPAQRLDLFVQVCRAVQHAHTKGIIHRDLKPGNVLVTEVDGRPVPRIIDFGIAKATAASVAGKAAFTEFRQFVGTPEYMSPEQSPGVDIDTRTDVYSLGVMLYELLTGVTPLDPARLRSAAWDQMLRMIREESPPRPSTRITARAPSATDGPPAERPGPAYLRGDLDWIVMRCLEKDRARRYQTADGLAADIERHIKGEAVLAAPPSRVYQARKFVGRHRVVVGAAGVAVAALVVGLSAALWQARIAARERDAAEASRGQTEQVAAFQAAQLEGIDPELMGARLREDLLSEAAAAGERVGQNDTQQRARQADLARDLAGLNLTDIALLSLKRNIFERAVAAIDEKFGDQPRVQAELLCSTGDTLANLGLNDDAIPVLSRGLDLYRRELGEEHAKTLAAYNSLGISQLHSREFDQAEASLRHAADGRRRVLGEDAPDTLLSLSFLAALDKARGKLAEAETGYRDILARLEREGLAEETGTLNKVLSDLSITLMRRGKYEDAQAYAERALELSRKTKGDEHPNTLNTMANLAAVLHARGNLAEATALTREVVTTSRRVLGDQHPSLLSKVGNLGVMLAQQNQLDEAEPLQREAMERQQAVLGPAHPDTLTAVNNYGMLLCLRGKYEQGAEAMAEGVRVSRTGGEGAMPLLAILLHHQADALRLAGRAEEAEAPALEAVALYRKHPDWSVGEGQHADTVLVDVLKARGDFARAGVELRTALDAARAAEPPADAGIAAALAGLGMYLLERKDYAGAEPVLRECMEIRGRILPEGNPGRWRYFFAMNLLGAALTGQAADPAIGITARSAKLKEAEQLLVESATAVRDDPRVPVPNRIATADRKRETAQKVVDLYELWNSAEPGMGYDAKAAEWKPRPAAAPER